MVGAGELFEYGSFLPREVLRNADNPLPCDDKEAHVDIPESLINKDGAGGRSHENGVFEQEAHGGYQHGDVAGPQHVVERDEAHERHAPENQEQVVEE